MALHTLEMVFKMQTGDAMSNLNTIENKVANLVDQVSNFKPSVIFSDAQVEAVASISESMRTTDRLTGLVSNRNLENYLINLKDLEVAVDKANVLATSRLWRETVQEIAPDYKDVELEFMFVDNAAMQIIQWPKNFDVVVTENMFGDILTDAASVITGSLGMLPSASLGDKVKLFEPIHGSYPEVAGQSRANPLGAILSAAMLLNYAFGLTEESDAIKTAVNTSLDEGIVTEDINAEKHYSTEEVGENIAKLVYSAKKMKV